MRFRRALAPLGLVAIAVTGTTCVFPTERDDELFVVISPLPTLIRGQETDVHAYALRRLGASGLDTIRNVSFVWSSSSLTVARIDALGHLVAVNPGTTTIRAAIANYDACARDTTRMVRVAAPLEIDSIRPDSVRFGDTITVFGVGVDSIFVARLGAADLIPYPFAALRDTSTGMARTTFWVPPPAETDSLFYIGSGFIGRSRDTVGVTPEDRYEPNDTVPASVFLDGPRPFPGAPPPYSAVLFVNPALAFEPLPRDVKSGADWFRLTQTMGRDLTIVFKTANLGTTVTAFVADSVEWRPASRQHKKMSWSVGRSAYACKGFDFIPVQALAESVVVALRAMPPRSLQLLATYTAPGPYHVEVREGYAITNAQVPRDAQEENDYCDAADARGSILLGPSEFRFDSLTIDNPHELDWIRFTVPDPGGGPTPTVRLRAKSRKLVQTAPDPSDIDLYVLRVPSGGLGLDRMAADTATGSLADLTVSLPPGDYYAVVVDFAGVPTFYAICIGLGAGACTLFPVAEES